MDCSESAHAAEYERVARRNNSLSSTGRILVFAFLFIVSAGIAGAFAALGAWLIFNRCWAQVVASPGGARLALRSHGREVEIGRHMNDEQRLALGRELGRQLSAAAAH